MSFAAVMLLQLMGCDAFHKAFSSVDGLTQTTVVQGAVMGIEAPAELQDLLAGTDFSSGVAVTAFVADASSVTDLADAPIDNAQVTVEGNVSEQAAPQGHGLYLTDPGSSNLVYADGDTWSLDIDVAGEVGTVALTLPAGANVQVDPQHDKNTPMSIDLSGQGFASAVVVVVDQEGTVTFDNAPKTITDLYESMNSTDPGTIEIPGSAFPSDGLYALGIAAMNHTTSEDVEGINTGLSKVRVGKMLMFPVSTVELP
jgi:hypothetical protein